MSTQNRILLNINKIDSKRKGLKEVNLNLGNKVKEITMQLQQARQVAVTDILAQFEMLSKKAIEQYKELDSLAEEGETVMNEFYDKLDELGLDKSDALDDLEKAVDGVRDYVLPEMDKYL